MTVAPRLRSDPARRLARNIGIPSGFLLILLLLTRALTIGPAPSIRVAWEPGISSDERSAQARRYLLTNGEDVDGATWSYDLTDTSSRNIAALLAEPRLVGTAFIDRETATVAADAPAGATTTWIGDRVPLFNRRGVAQTLAVLLASLVGTAGVLWLVGVGRLPDRARLTAFVTRGIPSLSAEALGVYRICFALGLAFVLSESRMAGWLAPGETHPAGAWLADWAAFRWIANRPDLVAGLEQLTFGAIALFGVGLWTRLSYGIVVANLTLWTFVRLQHTGTHPWAVLLITLWCLLAVRWGDALSVDRVIGRWRGRPGEPPVSGRAYGFAVWVPGLVLGTAMAAAAFAKVYGSGPAWVLGGAVKYHFVTDILSAPVDWGLWIASHHWAAVAASALAVGMEGSLIVAAFLRPGWARAAFGAGGCMLLLGFYLFQNEVWWAWWMLWACFFTPWQSLWAALARGVLQPRRAPDTSPSAHVPRAARPLTRVHYGIIGTVCGLQLFASVFQIEQQPLLSDYPMYSSTYPSTAAFDAQTRIQSPHRFHARTAEGERDVTAALEQTELDGPLRDLLLELRRGEPFTPDAQERVRWLATTFRERAGQALGVVTLMQDELAFDWATGRLYAKTPNTALIGVDTDALAIVPVEAPMTGSATWIRDRRPLLNWRRLAQTLAVLLAGLTAAAGVVWLVGQGYLRDRTRLVGVLTRGIPSLSAEALGVYRICFALGLAFVLSESRMAGWLAPGETHPAGAWLADWAAFRWIANRPDLVAGLEQLTFGAIALFGVGLWTRLSYGIVVANLTLWTFVRLQHTGTHPWAVLLITLWCLLAVRWGDALSVDRAIRRWRGRPGELPASGQAYGFAVWLPGLALGTAMTAAAFAKVYASGPAWVLGGAVKYHFVTDILSAPVDWGLWIASHHWAAVAASALAVGMEGSLIVAAFLRPGWARAAFGAGGCMLLLGFYLFQNEVWWAWWMLWACFFTPWQSLWAALARGVLQPRRAPDTSPSAHVPRAARPLTRVHYGIIGTVCGLQLFASVFQIEQQPLLSDYPMYSSTYPSTAAFDAQTRIQSPHRFHARTAEGERDVTAALEQTELDGPLRDLLLELRRGEPFTPDAQERVRWLATTFRERAGQALGVVTLMQDELAFDWATGRLYAKAPNATLIGLDTDALAIVPVGGDRR